MRGVEFTGQILEGITTRHRIVLSEHDSLCLRYPTNIFEVGEI
jgi:hypothetical protein